MLETILAQPETARSLARCQDPHAHRLGQTGRHHPGQLWRAVPASAGELHPACYRPLWPFASGRETPGVCADRAGVSRQAVTSATVSPAPNWVLRTAIGPASLAGQLAVRSTGTQY